MNHPCTSGADGKPCGVFAGPDKPWGPGNCNLCYLYATSPRHRAAWGGGDKAKRTEPCRYKGDTLRDEADRARTREIVTASG